MRTTSEFSAAGAMAILKHTHIPGDLVAHFPAQAATGDDFSGLHKTSFLQPSTKPKAQ
jgi:hypothetical protein